MAHLQVTIDTDKLKDLFASDEDMAALAEEIRRRERVIRIFPNSASAHRLVGALLQEQHEEGLTGRKYFDMTEHFEWRQVRRVSSGEAASIQHAA